MMYIPIFKYPLLFLTGKKTVVKNADSYSHTGSGMRVVIFLIIKTYKINKQKCNLQP